MARLLFSSLGALRVSIRCMQYNTWGPASTESLHAAHLVYLLFSQAHRYMLTHVRSKHKKELQIFLELLRWRLGTLIFCGRQCLQGPFYIPQAFVKLDRRKREEIVKEWIASGPSKAMAVRGLRGLEYTWAGT